jgi:hypothetical protein
LAVLLNSLFICFIITHFIRYIFDTKHYAMQFFKPQKQQRGGFTGEWLLVLQRVRWVQWQPFGFSR